MIKGNPYLVKQAHCLDIYHGEVSYLLQKVNHRDFVQQLTLSKTIGILVDYSNA